MPDMDAIIADILKAVDELKESGIIDEIVSQSGPAESEEDSGSLQSESSPISTGDDTHSG
jgi:uncharacterized protein YjgD (DUF1641 family)